MDRYLSVSHHHLAVALNAARSYLYSGDRRQRAPAVPGYAVGIKPNDSEITDIFIISPAQVRELGFHDPSQAPEYEALYGGEPTPEQVLLAESNREMAVRLCWKPYMYDPRLTSLLQRVKIPTRMVWGKNDQIVPLECGELYKEAISGSDLVVIDNCGHSPQVEKPDEFIKTALEFLA